MSDAQETSDQSTVETDQTTDDQTTEASDQTTDQSAEQKASDAWGADWREKHADGDEKVLKRLQRYTDPGAAMDAMLAAQNKIASGDLKSALPEDATEDQIATYRQDNGIPDTAADYEINLASGLVIGEQDQPVVDSFLEAAHAGNFPPSQVNQALDWYMQHTEQMAEAQDIADDESAVVCEEALRLDWEGGEYRVNTTLARNFLDSAPEGLKENIMGGRMADGTPIGNNADMIRFLAQSAREINPIATIVPGTGEGAMQAITSEMGELRTLMGDRSSKYWKGAEANKLQARYKELVSANQKFG